jgi:tetratricopeptide (TPR) repeat protein
MNVSPTFVRRFNVAAALARARHFQDALAAYRHVYEPFEDQWERRVATVDFTVLVELRMAATLAELRRLEEARALYESDVVQQLLPRTTNGIRYEYHFGYGNLLYAMGEADQGSEQLQRAADLGGTAATGERESPDNPPLVRA